MSAYRIHPDMAELLAAKAAKPVAPSALGVMLMMP